MGRTSPAPSLSRVLDENPPDRAPEIWRHAVALGNRRGRRRISVGLPDTTLGADVPGAHPGSNRRFRLGSHRRYSGDTLKKCDRRCKSEASGPRLHLVPNRRESGSPTSSTPIRRAGRIVAAVLFRPFATPASTSRTRYAQALRPSTGASALLHKVIHRRVLIMIRSFY